MKLLATALSATVLILAAGQAGAATIYANDFESNSTANLTGVTTIATAPSGEKFLGHLTQGGSSTLTLDTSAYTGVSVAFDLYTIQSLDGWNGGLGGHGDAFKVIIDGVTVSNYNYANCCFSNDNPYVPTASYHLGWNFYGDDHTYRLSFSAPSISSLAIQFIGNADQPAYDESFGVDNILVSGTLRDANAVPEPATWAMMIIGFGGIGAALRGRRRVFAAA